LIVSFVKPYCSFQGCLRFLAFNYHMALWISRYTRLSVRDESYHLAQHGGRSPGIGRSHPVDDLDSRAPARWPCWYRWRSCRTWTEGARVRGQCSMVALPSHCRPGRPSPAATTALPSTEGKVKPNRVGDLNIQVKCVEKRSRWRPLHSTNVLDGAERTPRTS